MILELTEEERYCVFVLFGGGWGGSEEALLARDEVYEALALERFENIDPRIAEKGLGKVATRPFELTAEGAEHLRLTITANPQQPRQLGRASARMLRRIRAAMPKAPEVAPPPAAELTTEAPS